MYGYRVAVMVFKKRYLQYPVSCTARVARCTTYFRTFWSPGGPALGANVKPAHEVQNVTFLGKRALDVCIYSVLTCAHMHPSTSSIKSRDARGHHDITLP